MKSQAVIESARIVAILRSSQPVDLVASTMALIAGGIRAIEIPLATPGCLTAVGHLRQEIDESIALGVGTVLTADDARRAIDAGAQFLLSPIVDRGTIEFAQRRLVPIAPGALTPNECHEAHLAGATFIKLFPAGQLSPRYVQEMLVPLPMLKLMPSGGVTLDNLGDWLSAGSAAVAVGSALFDSKLAERRDFAHLTDIAKRWSDRLQQLSPQRGR
jgi:2-dehydro-3-deoxyphosphogluconate aldolase / (4S)-4-hydroxy-2-oxoglutarate aldolase